MAETKKQKLAKPELPGGFRDYSPAEAIAKQKMIAVMRQVFESFGFDPLETSSVQRTEVLTGGEEDSGKIIFNVKGSRTEDAEESDTSLRFDLTVPLARFVAANPDIPKPFKRYEIGRVWRGERPQQGRYREFMQADFDIVGTSAAEADAEIAAIYHTALKKLGIENFFIAYNNRKYLENLPEYAGFSKTRLWEALRIIDKRDKIGDDEVRKELANAFDPDVAEKIISFLIAGTGIPYAYENYSSRIKEEFSKIEDAFLALTGLKQEESVQFFAPSLTLVRGLSYYTGSVFEVYLRNLPEIGSIGGGGRYDDLLARFTGQPIPAVGASIGVDRLFAAMKKLETLEKKLTSTQVLIMQITPELASECQKTAKELRDAGINTALYLGDERSFQAQLAYAVKKEIPYVIIYGEEEAKKGVLAVKNLETREQKEIERGKIAEYLRTQIPEN